jgi:hypothetical protein
LQRVLTAHTNGDNTGKVACRKRANTHHGAVHSVPRRPVTLPPSVLPMAKDRGRPLRWRLHQGLKEAI